MCRRLSLRHLVLLLGLLAGGMLSSACDNNKEAPYEPPSTCTPGGPDCPQ